MRLGVSSVRLPALPPRPSDCAGLLRIFPDFVSSLQLLMSEWMPGLTSAAAQLNEVY